MGEEGPRGVLWLPPRMAHTRNSSFIQCGPPPPRPMTRALSAAGQQQDADQLLKARAGGWTQFNSLGDAPLGVMDSDK